MTAQRFLAPWSALLMLLTSVGSAVVFGAAYASSIEGNGVWPSVLVLIWLACLAGHVRGYAIDGSQLRIERLLYSNTVDLSVLTAAEVRPNALRRAIRLGNGGLFSFSGWYWNKTNGWMRVVATDVRSRCVLLKFDGSTWMVSPDDPRGFVEAVRRAAGIDQ